MFVCFLLLMFVRRLVFFCIPFSFLFSIFSKVLIVPCGSLFLLYNFMYIVLNSFCSLTVIVLALPVNISNDLVISSSCVCSLSSLSVSSFSSSSILLRFLPLLDFVLICFHFVVFCSFCANFASHSVFC